MRRPFAFALVFSAACSSSVPGSRPEDPPQPTPSTTPSPGNAGGAESAAPSSGGASPSGGANGTAGPAPTGSTGADASAASSAWLTMDLTVGDAGAPSTEQFPGDVTASYAVGAGVLTIQASSTAAQSDVVTIRVHATTPGLYACDASTSVLYTRVFDPGSGAYGSSGTGTCSVNLTTFGAVGGNVFGAFTATLVGANGVVTVNDGSFAATRGADQP